MQTFPVSNSFFKFHFYSNHNCSNMVATIQIASRFCKQVGEYKFFLTNSWLPAGCGLGLECQKLYKITFQHHTQCTQTHTHRDRLGLLVKHSVFSSTFGAYVFHMFCKATVIKLFPL